MWERRNSPIGTSLFAHWSFEYTFSPLKSIEATLLFLFPLRLALIHIIAFAFLIYVLGPTGAVLNWSPWFVPSCIVLVYLSECLRFNLRYKQKLDSCGSVCLVMKFCTLSMKEAPGADLICFKFRNFLNISFDAFKRTFHPRIDPSFQMITNIVI